MTHSRHGYATPQHATPQLPLRQHAQRNAYTIMETPPQWLACDGLIYWRVNVAKVLIACARARFAARCRNHRYAKVSQVPCMLQLRTKFWKFINHEHAWAMELSIPTIRPLSRPYRAPLARRRAARSARETASTTRSRDSLRGRTRPTRDRRHARRRCRA